MILSEAKGRALAVSWEKHRHDKAYRQRLFRDLARICLSMNRTPMPRIGSLSFESSGVVTLSNRPLNMYFQLLENEGIPSGVPRQRTYSSVEPYISDLLSFQDNKLLYQPNAIHHQEDGEMQLAALTALRATMHRFIRTDYRDGPFYYTLTDLQQNNIFVDEQWNVHTVIDLEWAQSQPIEMQLPPYWLTSRPIDAPSMMPKLSPSWAPCSMSILTSTKPRKRLGMAFCFMAPSCAMCGRRAAFVIST
ncbi:hypothetical protein VTK56DRAFT_214 [Thermocarpiscus australiensis]